MLSDTECPDCGKTFAKAFSLKRHKENPKRCFRPDDRNGPFACSQCGKCYSAKSCLARHMIQKGCGQVDETLELLLDGQEEMLRQQLLSFGEQKEYLRKLDGKMAAFHREQAKKIDSLQEQVKKLLEMRSEEKLHGAAGNMAGVASARATGVGVAGEGQGVSNAGNAAQRDVNINNNDNSDRHIDNSITLNVYGKENTSMITLDTIAKIAEKVSTPSELAMGLIDLVYTDKANQNAHITNLKEPSVAVVYEGSPPRWKMKATEEVAQQITAIVGAAMERTVDPLSKVTLHVLGRTFDNVVITKGEMARNSKEVAKALEIPLRGRFVENRPDKPIKLG